MKWLSNISLKVKLTILLVALTCTMLSVYGFLALSDFENDKIAYVQDTSRSFSRSAALQIRTELSLAAERIKYLTKGYIADNNDFKLMTKQALYKEPHISALYGYHFSADSEQYQLVKKIAKPDLKAKDRLAFSRIAEKILPQVLEHDVAISRFGNTNKWLMGLRFEQPGSAPVAIFALIEQGHFLGLFDSAQMQDTYVVDRNNRIVIETQAKTYKLNTNELTSVLKENFKNVQAPEGTREASSKNGEKWLISFADVGIGHIRIMSVISKAAALQAVQILMIKSALFILFLFFLTVFLSVLSSVSLTSSLKRLLAATNEIARGNFNILVKVRGRDEIGALSNGFNIMTQEIQRLMKETAEKARMESELKTARLVQSTLFPHENFIENDIEIHGHYEPASECSGDWWHYYRTKNKTLFCIGDATGHGVPAALLTSAARSAASALETFPDLPLHDMMAVFNRAIYNTAQGQVLMTFFLGSYDHRTGEITYCNASHEPPFLVPEKSSLKKSDLNFLIDVTGPRLGERPDSQYQSAKIIMRPGDRLMLYTDGVTELQNKNGQTWGERAFLNCMIRCSNEKKDLPSTMNYIANELSTFRQDHHLHDDITYFMVTRAKAA